MSFVAGDRIILALPYTLNSNPLPPSDGASILQVGATGTVVSGNQDERSAKLVVAWDGHPNLWQRYIDPGCVDLMVDEAEVDDAMRSIANSWKRNQGE